MTIRSALEQIPRDEGKRLAEEYFAESTKFPGTGAYTGSHFETFAEAPNPPCEVTSYDLLAVQTLAVTVPSRAALGILGDSATKITELLERICPETKIEEIQSVEEFEKVLGKESAAQELWDLLRRNPPHQHRWNVGPTIASKIFARKRPHLIPIDDFVVMGVTGVRKEDTWRSWWEELRADGYLIERADEIREHVGRTQLSTLRTLDVVLWKWGARSNRKS